jgi:hypothetical protein
MKANSEAVVVKRRLWKVDRRRERGSQLSESATFRYPGIMLSCADLGSKAELVAVVGSGEHPMTDEQEQDESFASKPHSENRSQQPFQKIV